MVTVQSDEARRGSDSRPPFEKVVREELENRVVDFDTAARSAGRRPEEGGPPPPAIR
jgi:hypothetical protein